MWEFPELPKEQWLDRLQAELKDNFNKTKYTNTLEDLCIDLKHLEPRSFRFANRESNEPISNGFQIQITDEKSANQKALSALESGVSTLWFGHDTPKLDLKRLFKDILLEYITVVFESNCPDTIAQLTEIKKQQNLKHLYIIDKKSNFVIEACNVREIGGNSTEQIKYALKHTYSIFSSLSKQSESTLFVKIGTSGDYFIDLSCFITTRILLNKILKKCGITNSRIKICATISRINKSNQDHETNLLRLSTEILSSILGNSDLVLNQELTIDQNPNVQYKEIKDMANVFNVLFHESHIINSSSLLEGTEIIHEIIFQLMKMSWEDFVKYQSKSLEEFENTCAKSISKKRELLKNLISNKEKILIGINKYTSSKKQLSKTKSRNFMGFPFLTYQEICE